MKNNLENHINKVKQHYLDRYGVLDWRWEDEGIVYTLLDYLSSCGVFTEIDRKFADENGFGDVLRWVEDLEND